MPRKRYTLKVEDRDQAIQLARQCDLQDVDRTATVRKTQDGWKVTSDLNRYTMYRLLRDYVWK